MPKTFLFTNLNPSYIFKSLTVTENNKETIAALKAIIKNIDNVSERMIVVEGKNGSGKTYLLNAIGNEIKKKYKSKSVVFFQSFFLSQSFVKAVSEDNVLLFFKLLYQYDVILIDDFDYFFDKPVTQEIILEILSYLSYSKRIVFVTSAKKISGLYNKRELSLFYFLST